MVAGWFLLLLLKDGFGVAPMVIPMPNQAACELAKYEMAQATKPAGTPDLKFSYCLKAGE